MSSASPLRIDNPALAVGEVITVSGANGYIASRVCDQLLAAGYIVRGAIRDTGRCAWLQNRFDSEYGYGRFKLCQVSDITQEGAFDELLEGAAGVIHTAAIATYGASPDVFLSVNVGATLNIAKSAARSPSVKRFVYMSSSSTLSDPKPGVPYELNADTYNEEALALAFPTDGSAGSTDGLTLYSATKTKAEQDLWRWYNETKPQFVLNSVTPAGVFGSVLSPDDQGFPTSVGFAKRLWDGDVSPLVVQVLQPQWYIDVLDVAHLHIGALLITDVRSERLLAYAGKFTINDLLQVYRNQYPDRQFPDDVSGVTPDIGRVPNERAQEIMRKMGLPGWTSLDDSLKPLCKQFIAA